MLNVCGSEEILVCSLIYCRIIFWQELNCYIPPAQALAFWAYKQVTISTWEYPHQSSTQLCLLSRQTLAFNGAFWAYEYFSVTVHSQPANLKYDGAFWVFEYSKQPCILSLQIFSSVMVSLSLWIRESSGALWAYEHCRQPCIWSLRIFQPCEPMNTRM